MARRLPWSRRGRSPEPVTETAPAVVVHPAPRGYVEAIPRGGTRPNNPGEQYGGTNRAEFMAQLYSAYLSCPWSSAAVDTVARTVTAGGLHVVPDSINDESGTRITPKPGKDVLRLQGLLDFVNPREDIRQLYRGVITDLQVFGDAFLEVVWWLGQPVALYSLDSPTMIPLADEHGTITGYTQVLDSTRTATFEPHEVIQVSLDSPRGGIYGVSPTQKNLLPITAWLFTEALLKETMRKGNPSRLHVDFPIESDDTDAEIWAQKYAVRNMGIANLGTPILSRGNVQTKEIQVDRIAEYLGTLNNQRDLILSGYGVPPAKVGVIESGNLGGGTGSSQDRTFKVNTCGPLDELALEKFNYHLTRQGFGIDGWRLKSGEVDWRDDKVIEDIRDQRLRNGSWTLNRYRAEINEPPVEGGDTPLLVERQLVMTWGDVEGYSAALVKSLDKTSTAGSQVAQATGESAEGALMPSAEVLDRFRQLRSETLSALTRGSEPRLNVSEASSGPASVTFAKGAITVQAAPVPAVTVNQTHEHHHQAPVITVEASPTPNVTVDAPITVQAAPAPSVTVEPAQVSVPVTVTAPVVNVQTPVEAPKKTTAVRNADGSVTVTTEPKP